MDARSAKALSKMIGPRWQGDADSIFEGRCFINEYVDAADGGKIEVINPATNEVCGTCAAGNEKDIDKAVAAAKESFKAKLGGRWHPGKNGNHDEVCRSSSSKYS